MWTRGPDKEQPGAFAYELYDGFNLVKRVGGFATHTEADRAAEHAQRLHLMPAPAMTLDEVFRELDEIDAMSNAELLAALLEP